MVGIAVPVYFQFTEEYKADLCEVNRLEMARLYKEFLMVEQNDHSPAAFGEFSRLMMDKDYSEDDGDDKVPFL